MSNEAAYLERRRRAYQSFVAKGFTGVCRRTSRSDGSTTDINISGVGVGASTKKDDFGAILGSYEYVIAMQQDNEIILEGDRLITDTRDEVVLRADPIRIGETIIIYEVVTEEG